MTADRPSCPYCQQPAGTAHRNDCRLYTDRVPTVTADQIRRARTDIRTER